MKLPLVVIPAFAWLLISVVFFAIGEYYSKVWALKPHAGSAFLAVLMYSIGSLLWLPALLAHNQLVVMGRIWLLLATVGSMGVGLFIFHEHMTVMHWIGVAMATAAIFFLSW